MKIIITESQYNFIKRRYLFVRQLLDRELYDQVPCYYRNSGYGFNGYLEAVLEGVTEFVVQEYHNLYDMDEGEYDEKHYEIYGDLEVLFGDEIKDFYVNKDCTEYEENMNRNEDNNN